MNDFEREPTRALFDTITAGLDFNDFEVNPDEMHKILAGGDPVLLDAFAGEDLRDQLVTATDDAEALLAFDNTYKQPIDPMRAHYITNALSDEICEFLEQKPVTGQLALKGINTFAAPSVPDVEPDRVQETVQDVLQEDEVLLGNIHAVMYGKFLWAEPESVKEGLAAGKIPRLAKAWGGILQLTDVRICDTDAIGHIDRVYSSVFVPVHKKAFAWLLETQ